MKMKLLVALAMCSWSVMAQESWHPGGVVVLREGQVVSGEVMFHSDVVLLRTNGQVTVYPAHKISSFRFYDVKENINCHYLSLVTTSLIFSELKYYEVVTWGEVTVVRRNKSPLLDRHHHAEDYLYYTWYKGKLTELRKFRSDVYPSLLSQFPYQVTAFVSEEKLNPGKLSDAIRIALFYNRQSQTRTSIAAL